MVFKPDSEVKKAIQMSRQEYEKFCRDWDVDKLDDPELKEWMQEKGLEFNQGMVDIEIDGKAERMQTAKTDWGTLEYRPGESPEEAAS